MVLHESVRRPASAAQLCCSQSVFGGVEVVPLSQCMSRVELRQPAAADYTTAQLGSDAVTNS